MEQPDPSQVALGRGESGPTEPGHESTGPQVQLPSQLTDGNDFGRQPNQGLEEQPVVRWRITQGVQNGALDAGDGPSGWRTDDLAQALPPRWGSDVDHLLYSGGTEVQQGLGGQGLVLRHQSDRRNTWKISNQMPHGTEIPIAAPVDRYQERIHPPLTHDAHGFGNRVAVNDTKTAVACCIDPGPLARHQHRRHGGVRGVRRFRPVGHAWLQLALGSSLPVMVQPGLKPRPSSNRSVPSFQAQRFATVEASN